MQQPSSEPLLELAMKRHSAGELSQAAELYQQILAAQPDDADVLQLLGVVNVQLGRKEQGLDMLRRALALNPQAPDCHYNLGKALAAMSQHEEAVASLRQAVALKDDFAEAHQFLGLSLRALGRLDQAAQAFDRAVAIKPDYVEAWNNLGTVLRGQGKMDEAIAAYGKALALRGDVVEIHYNLGNALEAAGRIEESAQAFRAALALRRDDAKLHSNLLLSLHFSSTADAEAIFQEHLEWDRRHAKALAAEIRPHANSPQAGRRLRVGYVSPDFRDHPVRFFFETLVAHHDSAQTEIFAYADLAHGDAVSRRLQGHCHHWRDITAQRDEDVAETIRQDGIDILVDLAGHMAGNRLLVFARQPAPIQVSYLGYPDTTGLSAMDYRLTDPHVDPPGQTEQFYSEQLVRLPRTFACYMPAEDAPAVSALPAEAKGFVTFASFNSLYKLNAALLQCWAGILLQLPRSQLIVAADGLEKPAVQEHFSEIFERHGIERQRVRLGGRQPWSAYLALHREVDVALDAFPVNGHTVTCHALWMGVPVVCLSGTTCCQRLGSSVLSNVDLPQLVAHEAQSYARLAVGLANDLPALAALRAGLRDRVAKSPLLDAPGFARDVEAAYRNMWRRWCQRQG